MRGLAPLQHAQPVLPPALGLSSTLFNNVLAEEGEGDEAGMGRGRRKRRASSAMMAAMGTNTPAAPSPLGSGTTTPLAIPSPRPAATGVSSFAPIAPAVAAGPSPSGSHHRRTQSMSGPSSAPTKSSIPRLKLRLTSLDEGEGVDSDGHTGEAAEHRRKNKKKVRTAASEGVSRAGSVDSSVVTTDDDEFGSRSTAFSSVSASALLAQSLLAASTSGAVPPSALSLAPLDAVSPDSLSLANNGSSFPFAGGRATAPLLSVSAPNIFSHHFANAPSPPDVIMDDVSSRSATSGVDSHTTTSAGALAAGLPSVAGATLFPPAADSPSPQADEDDFHEAMLRGDDFEFEWGSESYTTAGTSSLETSVAVAAADLARAFSQQAKQHDGNKAASPGPGDKDKDREDAAVDTPATTPRSPGKEADGADDADAPGEAPQRRKDDAIELVHGPLGTISRVGMSTTLCGEMAPASDEDVEDGDVVIVPSPVSRAPAGGASRSALTLSTCCADLPCLHRPSRLSGRADQPRARRRAGRKGAARRAQSPTHGRSAPLAAPARPVAHACAQQCLRRHRLQLCWRG